MNGELTMLFCCIFSCFETVFLFLIYNLLSGMSLDGLRKPKIDSWDSMGILGLTSKMWNDTSKQQETFMSSTGLTLREETSTYIM